jgi:hypothetical protein
MAEQFEALNDKQIEFITAQHLFFVATAAADGNINLSPKGMDCLRIIDANKVVWLNLTGSGNETAAHLLKNDRMTLMFCSFTKQPMILRLYGTAITIHPRDEKWETYASLVSGFTGARQFYELNVNVVQTSCGYAVPFFDFQGERPTLTKWADNKGRTEIEAYWEQKNQTSLDGLETRIVQAP